MSTTITVERKTWEYLAELKLRMKLKSMDSAIQYLIRSRKAGNP